MPATTSKAQPILPYKILGSSDANAMMRRMLEKSGKSFLIGTPVQVDVAGGSGYIIDCPTMNSNTTNLIAGFCTEGGHSLTSDGTGSGPGGTPGGITYGSVQNQSSAVLIADAGPIIDGTIGLNVACDTTIFQGVMGDSSDNTLAVLAVTQMKTIYGLFKDPGNSYWYVDHNVTATANGACVELVEFIDAIGTLNGKVAFRVLRASQQLFT